MQEDIHQQANKNALISEDKKQIEADPNFIENAEQQKKEKLPISAHPLYTNTDSLPDVKTLSEYAALIPNGADRIMQLYEKQLDHRIKIETQYINSQIISFAIALIALGAAAYCIIRGSIWAGALLGLGGFAVIIIAAIRPRSLKKGR